MAADASEIVVGANGKVWVASTTDTQPTDSDTLMTTVDAQWTDLGYVSEDGVTFTDSKETESIMAWQSFYAVRRIVTARDASVSFSLRQWNSDTLAFALGGGSLTVTDAVQTITLTSFDTTDSFKLTYQGVETAAFVRLTNATAAAIQTALRTRTGDTGLTVTGTTDAGPFTVTFSPNTHYDPLTVTSSTGGSGGSVAQTSLGGEAVYTPPSPEDIDERAITIEWQDGDKDYRLNFPKGIVTEAVETNIVRTAAADLPITFAATPNSGQNAYILYTNDPAFA